MWFATFIIINIWATLISIMQALKRAQIFLLKKLLFSLLFLLDRSPEHAMVSTLLFWVVIGWANNSLKTNYGGLILDIAIFTFTKIFQFLIGIKI